MKNIISKISVSFLETCVWVSIALVTFIVVID